MKNIVFLLLLALPMMVMSQERTAVKLTQKKERASCDRCAVELGEAGNDLSTILKSKFLFLWTGKFSGDNLKSDLNDTTILVTGKDFTSTIPMTSAATFSVPNKPTYKASDSNHEDYLWFNRSATVQSVVDSNLIRRDYKNTLIAYTDKSPYSISKIGILKSGYKLSVYETNLIHQYFRLNMFWSDSLNTNGFFKENRLISSPVILSGTAEEAHKDRVLLNCSEYLDENSIPATSAFALTGKTISGVSISGKIITVTVTVAYTYDDNFNITYTKPASNPLIARSGQKLSTLTQHVVNNLNNPYGPELINQSTWYTAGYWNTFGVGWAQSGNTLTHTGGATFLIKTGFWVVGKTYRVAITITTTSGGLNAPYSGAAGNQHTITVSEVYNQVPITNTSMYIYANWVGTISGLSIKEVL